MKYAILIDFGSTYTKVVLINITQRKLIHTDRFPSTVHTDAKINLNECYQSVKKLLTPQEFNSALKLSCSSAAGGLRMAVVGLTKTLSITAGKNAVFGAGAKIVGTFCGKIDSYSIRELESLDLEILFLCGGYENGNTSMVIRNAEMIAQSNLKVPIIYSGNCQAAQIVRQLLISAHKECYIIDNILPKIGVIHMEPAQRVIRDLFMQRITNMKGLAEVKEHLDYILMPTPAAVLSAGELLSKGTSSQKGIGSFMIVDLGGATTDVYSFDINKVYKGAKLVGIDEPFSKRTVEGDMGMRESSICLLNEKTIEQLSEENSISEELIIQGLNKRISHTSYLSDTEEEMKIDQMIAKNAVAIAARRHVGYLEYGYSNDNLLLQHGKNLTNITKIIGTGGAVVNNPHPDSILSQVNRQKLTEEYKLLPKITDCYIDKEYIFYATGLLSNYDKEAAFAVMYDNLIKV